MWMVGWKDDGGSKKETRNGWMTDGSSRNPTQPSPNANTSTTTNNNNNIDTPSLSRLLAELIAPR